jgi:hypothetical protein
MQGTLSLEALYEQLKQQDTEFAQAQELLGSLDSHLGLNVDADALSAIEEALDVTPVRAPVVVPGRGMRA